MSPNILLLTLFFFLNIQSVVLLSIDKDVNIKPFHVYSILLVVALFTTRFHRIGRSFVLPLTFFLAALFLSSMNTLRGYPLDSMFFNYSFALLVFATTFVLASYATERKVLDGLEVLSWIVLVMAVLNTLYHWEAVLEFLREPFGHPHFPTIYGGGPNIQGTFLAMNGVFVRRQRNFWIYWIVSLSLSVLYATRIGFFLHFFLLLVRSFSALSRAKKLLWIIIIPAFVLLLLLELNPYILERIRQIGEDVGSVSRWQMWQASAGIIFEDLPLIGYGAGNAMYILHRRSNFVFWEDNIHNYLLQITLEFGFVGLAIWLAIVIKLVYAFYQSRGKNPLLNYIILFIIASFVQFRGAEPLLWYMMGLYLGLARFGQSAATGAT